MAEFKDRGSRFIAYAFPADTVMDFKKRLKELKAEHPKAVHHCFAYRIGIDGITFHSSDDGEPSGTAGKPILGQIDSRQLTNTALIVVRYFGGIKLGVPGLIHAYKTAVSMVLEISSVIRKPILVHVRLEFDYTVTNEVMQVIKKYRCEIFKQDMQLYCVWKIGIPKNVVDGVLTRLSDKRGIEIIREFNL